MGGGHVRLVFCGGPEWFNQSGWYVKARFAKVGWFISCHLALCECHLVSSVYSYSEPHVDWQWYFMDTLCSFIIYPVLTENFLWPFWKTFWKYPSWRLNYEGWRGLQTRGAMGTRTVFENRKWIPLSRCLQTNPDPHGKGIEANQDTLTPTDVEKCRWGILKGSLVGP